MTATDIPTLFEHQRDPEASRMAAFPPRDRAAHLAHWTKILADRTDTVASRAVVWDGALAGHVGAWLHEGNWLVGYWIGRDYWGRGIATAALEQFLERFDRRPLRAHVARHNLGSIRVLEKCGFTALPGVFRTAEPDPVEERIMVLET